MKSANYRELKPGKQKNSLDNYLPTILSIIENVSTQLHLNLYIDSGGEVHSLLILLSLS